MNSVLAKALQIVSCRIAGFCNIVAALTMHMAMALKRRMPMVQILLYFVFRRVLSCSPHSTLNRG